MPNIRSQAVSKDGIEIVASDGRTFAVTRAQVVAHFVGETGSRAQRRTKTLSWLRQSIEDALGPEQVSIGRIRNLDFDDLDATEAMLLEVVS